VSTGLAVPVFCVGLALTLGATVVFAREIDRAGERLRVSEGLHGILTALGADAPEISTAIVALVSSHATIGVGVVVGSNVFNLAALLGLSALVAGRVRMHRHGLLLNGGVALVVTGLAAAQILGALGAVTATVLLLAVFAPYVGSVGMVRAATDLGSRFGVPDVVIGTLVLAALTSLPNVLTAVRLALHGRGAATVSEAFNSNTLNILAGIAIPSLVLALGTASGVEVFSVWWLVGMTLVAVALAYSGGGLRRFEGAVVVALYVVFAAVIATR